MIIVCDLDGTIANNEHRLQYLETRPKDWESFYNAEHMKNDVPFPQAQLVFRKIMAVPSIHMVFLTGRPVRTQGVTAWWLYANYGWNVVYEDQASAFLGSPARPGLALMLMRSDTDRRTADVYKEQKVQALGSLRPDEAFLFIDDDERCYEMYSRYGVILRTPECW